MLLEEGLPNGLNLMAETSAFSEDQGFRPAAEMYFKDSPFTAIVAANDLPALRAY